MSRFGGQQSEIYVMNADGSAQTRLGARLRSEEMFPRFSPDGRLILLESFQPGGRSIVLLLNADENHQQRLAAGLSFDWQPAGEASTR